MNNRGLQGKLALAGTLLAIAIPNFVRAQSATADWEKAAGGKMAFEVASVKENTSPRPPAGPVPTSNISLNQLECSFRPAVFFPSQSTLL
jgi:hypothetical protein